MEEKSKDLNHLIVKSFETKKFDFLVRIESKINDVKSDNNVENIQNLTEVSCKIASSLEKLNSTMENVNKLAEKNKYKAKWVLSGKSELTQIFSSLDLLEFNVDSLLTELEKINAENTESLLDSLNGVCILTLAAKKLLHPFKIRLNVLNHYSEIVNEVLESVTNEIKYCVEQLEDLQTKRKLLSIERELAAYSLEELKLKKRESEIVDSLSKYNGFIIFSTIDGQIFDSYTKLYDSLLPISESLKVIPFALENFYNSAKHNYKELVIKVIDQYEFIISSYNEYKDNLKLFKNEYVTKRNNLLCQKVFEIVHVNHDQKLSVLEDVLHILKPIEIFYGLAEEYSEKLRAVEFQLDNFKQKENLVQTPVPKNRGNPRSKRVFSTPLADSLNMKPILSDSISTERSNVKIFQTPRIINENIFSKTNIEIIEKIKEDIDLTDSSDLPISDTPSADSSFGSVNSSPEAMKTKNIFDSPDPFITPNSRSYKARLPFSTPLTTPRITPTKRYIMPPLEKEPNQSTQMNRSQNTLPNRNINISQAPLLRFDLSTVIDMDLKGEYEAAGTPQKPKDCAMSSNHSVLQKQQLQNSPPARTSKIPLPKRPESRLSILRSASRLQTAENEISRRDYVKRSDSRLENIASNISSKLGTNSPVVNTMIKARPVTVMAQREIHTLGRPPRLAKLDSGISMGFSNIKTRGATSLGSRSTFGNPRVTSI